MTYRPPRSRQPQTPLPVDPQWAQGLDLLVNSALGYVNLVATDVGTDNSATQGGGPGGRSIRTAAAGTQGHYYGVTTRANSAPWTLLVYLTITGASAVTQGFLQVASTTANSPGPFILLQRNNTDLRVFVQGNYRVTETGSLVQNSTHCIAVTYDGATVVVARNGVEVGTYASVSLQANTATHLWIGNGYNGSAASDTYLTAYWTRSFTRGQLLSLSANPWQLFAPIPRRVWVPTSGSDVTAALTGAAATAGRGTVGVTHDQALTGSAATSAAGTAAPSLTIALSGNAATAAAGTVAPASDAALTGAAGTTAAGIAAPSTTVALAGSAGTSAAGSVAVVGDVTVALTGVSASAAAGSVSASSSGVGGLSKRRYQLQIGSQVFEGTKEAVEAELERRAHRAARQAIAQAKAPAEVVKAQPAPVVAVQAKKSQAFHPAPADVAREMAQRRDAAIHAEVARLLAEDEEDALMVLLA